MDSVTDMSDPTMPSPNANPSLASGATEQSSVRNSWTPRVLQQGPWDETGDPLSLHGTPALPMPVEVSDKESLAPFFSHLRDGGEVEATDADIEGMEPINNVKLIEFEKGVLYNDGRVDLCKMVTGPRNIGDLMGALETNTFAKHFLLGNNIVGPVGARAIADFIAKYPDRFETWYLAGNCIDTDGFKILVDAMITSHTITNVWLKRNPLLAAAAPDVFRLICQSPALRTLDLDQTAMGDAGVAHLFSMLAEHDQPVALRHVYLNGLGVSYGACEQIARYLSSKHSQLVSLYLSSNPIGDGVALLAPGIKSTRTLQRLALSSCGLKDEGTIVLLGAITGHPSIKTLDIGQAFTTQDLGMRFNWLTCSEALIDLINGTPLEYLNIGHTPLPQLDLNPVFSAVIASRSLLWFLAQPLVKGGRTHAEVQAGRENSRLRKAVQERLHENVRLRYDGLDYNSFETQKKRFLKSPEDVRLIDSVYRNRDTGLALRGLKHLNKWWDDDDETLQRVQMGVID